MKPGNWCEAHVGGMFKLSIAFQGDAMALHACNAVPF